MSEASSMKLDLAAEHSDPESSLKWNLEKDQARRRESLKGERGEGLMWQATLNKGCE